MRAVVVGRSHGATWATTGRALGFLGAVHQVPGTCQEKGRWKRKARLLVQRKGHGFRRLRFLGSPGTAKAGAPVGSEHTDATF